MGQIGGAEVVQTDHELQIAAGPGDAGVAAQAVDAVGVLGVNGVNDLVPALLGGQVGTDVAVFQVYVDHFVALAAENLHGLSADAAGAAGYHINSHKLLPPYHKNRVPDGYYGNYGSRREKDQGKKFTKRLTRRKKFLTTGSKIGLFLADFCLCVTEPAGPQNALRCPGVGWLWILPPEEWRAGRAPGPPAKTGRKGWSAGRHSGEGESKGSRP